MQQILYAHIYLLLFSATRERELSATRYFGTVLCRTPTPTRTCILTHPSVRHGFRAHYTQPVIVQSQSEVMLTIFTFAFVIVIYIVVTVSAG